MKGGSGKELLGKHEWPPNEVTRGAAQGQVWGQWDTGLAEARGESGRGEQEQLAEGKQDAVVKPVLLGDRLLFALEHGNLWLGL